jgi:tRNA G26 N,N-dimethylase Trm1
MMIGFAIHPFLVCKSADCSSGCKFFIRGPVFIANFNQQTIINHVTDPIKIKILNQSVKNFTRGHNNPQIKDKLKHHLGSFKKNDECADCSSGCKFFIRGPVFIANFNQQTIINQFV